MAAGSRGRDSYLKESYLRRGVGRGKKLITYHLINFKLQPRGVEKVLRKFKILIIILDWPVAGCLSE